tara:strand:+ start:66 stop:362 length:297 start_codon:yes stop_codon:yes gene_type:complete
MRFHAVSISDEYPEGKKSFTEAEETERDAEEAEYIAGADGREAERVRTDRDSKLSETDFHALSDTDMSEAMTTYRQALRDIPQQAEFPNTITWPTEPN